MRDLTIALVLTWLAGAALITGSVMIGGFWAGVLTASAGVVGYARKDIDNERNLIKSEQQRRQDARDAKA